MENVIINEFLPIALFFIVFVVVFSLMELILIFFLDWFIRSHWEWVVDVAISFEVHHRRIIKYGLIMILGVFVICLIIYSPLVPILTLSSYEFRCFALLLALVMVLIYLVNIRKSSKLKIEKNIYAVIFSVISLAFYVSILSVANENYSDYLKYVNKKFVDPTVREVGLVLDERKDKQLLENARQSYLDGKCEEVDYTKEEKQNLLKNMQLIGRHPDLAFGDKFVYIDDPKESLKGMSCSDAENTLLLLENGDWYWVSEEYIKFIK